MAFLDLLKIVVTDAFVSSQLVQLHLPKPSFFLLHAVVAVLLWLRRSVRNSFSPTLPAT